jgi:hypothetical protein
MLPTDALGKACTEVSSLKFPAKLWRLPPVCSQMAALRELTLQDYFGDTLDLRDLPQLQRVEGSASVHLSWVHADARTGLDISVPQRFRKVRAQRHVDGQPCRTHALPGHAYTYISPGSHVSDYTQFNGIAFFPDNGKRIVCRHIAWYVKESWPAIKQTKKILAPGFAGVATPSDLITKVDTEIQYRFSCDDARSKIYGFVNDKGFRTFAAKQLGRLMQLCRVRNHWKAWASLYLSSTNHVMNLLLSAKATTPPVYVATVVDPNALLARRRIEVNSLAAIQHMERCRRVSSLIETQQL